MERESMVFYRSYMEAFAMLPPESYKRVLQLVFGYAMDGIEPENDGSMEYIMFTLVRPQIDANNERYLNGCKGGAPIGNQNARKQPKTTKNNLKTTKNNQKQPNDNDNDNVNVNVNVNDNVNENVNGNGNGNDKEEHEKPTPNIDYQEIVDLYHSLCPSFPSIRSLTDTRRKTIRARLNTYSMDDFRAMFENAEASDFLKGKNNRNWMASFDWMLKDSNFAKILEGRYANRQAVGNSHGIGRNDWVDDLSLEVETNDI